MATDDDQPGGSSSRRPHVRRRIAVGAVGAAAVLGVGAYAITSHVTARDATTTRDAVAPLVSPEPASPQAASVLPSVVASGSPSGKASVSAQASAQPSPAKGTSSLSAKVRKEIDDAQAAAARDGHPVTKALPPPKKILSSSAVSTQVRNTKDGYLRITTARADLTDQKDQRMAADEGKKIGDVSCTQNFHFATNVKPKTIPTMMICWRVSAKRSVVTLGVTRTGKPSASTYAKVIEAEWSKLR